jgi:hypothetical protein
MAKKASPAQRARARRDPAIFQPPPRPKGDRTSAVRNLNLRARGRTYPVGLNIEGDTPWSLGMDQTGTVSLPIRDPSGRLIDVLDDEAHLMQDGVRVTIDGIVYVVSGIDHDGEGLYTLTVEDEVSRRLKQFDRYRSASRKTITRYGFIYGFVEEASRKPYPKMRAFIPEIDDKQPIRKPAKDPK